MFPGKESPWSILELDSASAAVRDVKRAYAKLLKQFRPDVDPEGFRRIHDAYQTVLKEIALRDETATDEASAEILTTRAPAGAAAPVPPAGPEPKLPLPFLAAMALLRTARRSGSPEGVPEAMAQLRQACGDDYALWRAWSEGLVEIFDEGLIEPGVAAFIEPNDILCELRAGSLQVAMGMLKYWHQNRLIAPMVTVGKALTAKATASAFDHPECGFFAMRLACCLAMAQPGGASLLLDAAFVWLPAEVKTSVLTTVEKRLHIARLFWHLPGNWQRFWETVLDELEAGRNPNWNSPEHRQALHDLMRIIPGGWPGWDFLKSIVPLHLWNSLGGSYRQTAISRRLWSDPPAKEWVEVREDIVPGVKLTAALAKLPRERWTWRRLKVHVPLLLISAGCLLLAALLPDDRSGNTKSPSSSRQTASSSAKKTASGKSRVSREEYLQRIDEYIQAAGLPQLQSEWDTYLKAGTMQRQQMMEKGGAEGAESPVHRALLVCIILHPATPAGMKARAVQRIERIRPPDEAIGLLRDALLEGSSFARMLEAAMLRIYKEHGSSLPEQIREELKALEGKQHGSAAAKAPSGASAPDPGKKRPDVVP